MDHSIRRVGIRKAKGFPDCWQGIEFGKWQGHCVWRLGALYERPVTLAAPVAVKDTPMRVAARKTEHNLILLLVQEEWGTLPIANYVQRGQHETLSHEESRPSAHNLITVTDFDSGNRLSNYRSHTVPSNAVRTRIVTESCADDAIIGVHIEPHEGWREHEVRFKARPGHIIAELTESVADFLVLPY